MTGISWSQGSPKLSQRLAVIFLTAFSLETLQQQKSKKEKAQQLLIFFMSRIKSGQFGFRLHCDSGVPLSEGSVLCHVTCDSSPASFAQHLRSESVPFCPRCARARRRSLPLRVGRFVLSCCRADVQHWALPVGAVGASSNLAVVLGGADAVFPCAHCVCCRREG